MRRGAWALLLAGGLGLPTPSAAAGDPPAPKAAPLPIGVDAALRKRVDEAIDRGAEWLLSRQEEDGHFDGMATLDRLPKGKLPPFVPPGQEAQVEASLRSNRLAENALVLYALRTCGVPAKDRRMQRGFRWLREEYVALRDKRMLRNYAVSLILLALEAHRNLPEEADPRDGRYGRSARRGAAIPPEDLEWMQELTAWLVLAQNDVGGFSYMSPGIRALYDRSNTQFSLLALKAARRCRIPVPRELWERALRMLLAEQESTGPEVVRRVWVDSGGPDYGSRTVAGPRDRARGWGYLARDPATGSMTSAGVSSLVICRSELLGSPGADAGLDARAAQAIWDGLAWLGLHFSVQENPGPADAPMMAKTWQYYWLYGLERAAVLAAVERVGDHVWYGEGARYLVQEQDKGGWWSQKGRFRISDLPPEAQRRIDGLAEHRAGHVPDTCFALLFLQRSTPRVERGYVATEAAGDSLDLAGAAYVDDESFRSLFDFVFRRFAAADPAGRQALSADFVRMGTRSIPLLVLLLDSEDAGRRGAAIDALRMTTGVTRGFDAAAPEGPRAVAVRAWEEWWVARRSRLVADAEAGRFRES